MGALNRNLKKAKQEKNDEFYTQLTDIEKELKHYTEHFRDKTVLCNCDDPEWSNFYKFFEMNFDQLELKRLIATHFDKEKPTYKVEIARDENHKQLPKKRTPLVQNGDFRSPECMALLAEADIVVTNPPFSLFRDYVATLTASGKGFLIIGSQGAISYKETFALIRRNVIWAGIDNGGTKWFKVPNDYEISTKSRIKVENGVKYFSMGSIYWYTNLPHKKRNASLLLYKTYAGNEADYPTYDNFDAINVDKVSDIPLDYPGVMGVPITFLDKYNPHQFEIVGNEYELGISKGRGFVNGKKMYSRIFIKHKAPLEAPLLSPATTPSPTEF